MKPKDSDGKLDKVGGDFLKSNSLNLRNQEESVPINTTS